MVVPYINLEGTEESVRQIEESGRAGACLRTDVFCEEDAGNLKVLTVECYGKSDFA